MHATAHGDTIRQSALEAVRKIRVGKKEKQIKKIAALVTRTRVSIAFGFSVGRSTHWAIPPGGLTLAWVSSDGTCVFCLSVSLLCCQNNNVAKYISVGRLFRNIHPSLHYSILLAAHSFTRACTVNLFRMFILPLCRSDTCVFLFVCLLALLPKQQYCQAHQCGPFIQKHPSIVTTCLRLTHSRVVEWLIFPACSSCPMVGQTLVFRPDI